MAGTTNKLANSTHPKANMVSRPIVATPSYPLMASDPNPAQLVNAVTISARPVSAIMVFALYPDSKNRSVK